MLQGVNQIASQQCLPAMLQQQYKALCVRYCTDIANHVVCNIANCSVQHCNNHIATMLQVHWQDVMIATLLHRCYNTASNVTTTVENLLCSTLHWHCKSQCATLHQQHCHSVAATLTSCEDCNIDAPCYNITNGYFCATLRQRCSVSTKLHFSNVSQQC